jgi:CubicO group peptidase (beta-lactamase class C family)
MKKNILICFLLISIGFTSCNTNDKTILTVNANQVNPTELNRFIQHQLDSLNVAGLSIAIIRNNKVVYNNAFGFKNLVTQEKCTQNTLFEACSLSKPVFAYFVMLQVKKEVIDLDIPLYKYLNNEDLAADERFKKMTARMVLCHTSGLPNWRDQTDGELKLLFEPGTKFGYSGEGYQYLKDVLKHLLNLDDKGLNKLFQEQVVKPLNLDFMQFTWQENFSLKKSYGHRNGKPTQNGPKFLRKGRNEFGAAYSLHTTSKDYAKFLIHMMNPKSDNKEIVEEMLSLQESMPNEDGEWHRSIAFPVKQVDNSLRYFHSGNNGDFRAYCQFYKDKGYGLVMFSNSDNFFSSNCAQNILEYLDDKWFYV